MLAMAEAQLVNRLGLGTWHTFNAGADEGVLSDLLSSVLSHGVRFIDTADSYADGAAESILGRILVGIPRDTFVLSSKCYFPTSDNPGGGLSPRHIREAVARSLDRLRVESLDIYYAHRFDPHQAIERVADTFNELIDQGVTAHWGICRWPLDQAANVIEYCRRSRLIPPTAQQYHYNLFSREAEANSFPLFHSHGLQTTTYSPLAQGVLTGKFGGGKNGDSDRASNSASRAEMWDLQTAKIAKVERWRLALAATGRSPTAAALGFCLRRPEIGTILVGARSKEQFEANLRSAAESFAPDVIEMFDDL